MRGIDQQRPSATRQLVQLRRRGGQARVVAGQSFVRRRIKRPVVAAAQEDQQRLRMQRLQDRVVDQLGEAGAIGGGPRLLRQRLQHVPRVVGAAEERAVQPLGRRLPDALPASASRPPKSEPASSPIDN